MAEQPKPIELFVPGLPAPKGSAKYVGKNKKTGRAVVVQDNAAQQKPWADAIKWLIKAKKSHSDPYTGPVAIDLDFILPRPKSHYGTGRNSSQIKQNAPLWHISKPDLDKLTRCVKDALTGEIWKDDSQCVMMDVKKHYQSALGDTGCNIKIYYL